MIPFLDIKSTYTEIKDEIDASINRVLNSGLYILGPEVDAFESEWADYCGSNHAVGVANGLDALILALRALKVGPGDEVIIPSNTYIASWLAISAVGAIPIPVEPCPITYNINVKDINKAITPATKAIMPVHLYGQPADLDHIIKLSKQSGISVIEDAAQAHGAMYKGKRIGSHGDIVCWSFYPGKNLGAFGDAGAITTNRNDLAESIRKYRNYGSSVKYVTEVKGTNSRLDPIQAAVLRAKLPHLDNWNDRLREISKFYTHELRDSEFILPKCPNWAYSVWHLFVIQTSNRDKLKSEFDKAGIGYLIHYPIPPHMQKAYKDLKFKPERLPLARQLADKIISLPIGPHLNNQSVRKIINVIKDV